MRKTILFLAGALLLCGPSRAQTGNTTTIPYTTDPTGHTCSFNMRANYGGHDYYCAAGVYAIVGSGGGNPGGTGTQLQYRSGASTFGGVAGSAVSTLGAVEFNPTPIAAPSAPVLTVTCTPSGPETCNATYSYVKFGLWNGVLFTPDSPSTSTAVGPVTLNATNHISIDGACPTGADHYVVQRTTAAGFPPTTGTLNMTAPTVCGTPTLDTGQATDSLIFFNGTGTTNTTGGTWAPSVSAGSLTGTGGVLNAGADGGVFGYSSGASYPVGLYGLASGTGGTEVWGFYGEASGAGDDSQINGAYFSAYPSFGDASSISDVFGVESCASCNRNATSTIGEVAAFYGSAGGLAGGVVDYNIGLDLESSPSGTIINNYGIVLGGSVSGSTTTNNYGIYMADVSGASTINEAIHTGLGNVNLGDHIVTHTTVTAPTVSGTGCSLGFGNDVNGQIIASAPAACALAFHKAYTAPVCTLGSTALAAVPYFSTEPTTSGFTVTVAAASHIHYHCEDVQ